MHRILYGRSLKDFEWVWNPRTNHPNLMDWKTRRFDRDEGDFGAISPMWCDECSNPVWKEGRAWMWRDGYTADYCPHCRGVDTVRPRKFGEQTPYKAIRRFRAQLDAPAQSPQLHPIFAGICSGIFTTHRIAS